MKTIAVYLSKRKMKPKTPGGKATYRYVMRWEDDTGWRCESTGTADKTQAQALQKVKWAELNIPGAVVAPEPAVEPEPVRKVTWDECKEAFKRAMQADNLRDSYVASAKDAWEVLRRMFPQVTSPMDLTADDANEYKRQRAEADLSPWSIRSDISTLRAVFGKWLMSECGLLTSNPFASVKPPRCDDPEVRIVAEAEAKALVAWLSARWNDWQLPLVYLQVLSLVGWRATETASIRADGLLADGHICVLAESSKTRKQKVSWLPAELYAAVQACSADGWAFGRFSDELRRHLILLKKKPNHAAKVKDFAPKRLVGWIQDELQRFHEERAEAAAEKGQPAPETFSLHDLRRTAVTDFQQTGGTENEVGVMVGATGGVMRKYYQKLDQMKIAKRLVQGRLTNPETISFARPLRA